MKNRWILTSLIGLGLVFSVPSARAISWIYDFPGSPGSGLAADQTNPQPFGATFGDWQRVNVQPVPTADAFDSNYWNTTSVFDPTQYVSFSVTADPGFWLNLSLLTFDEMRTSGGPTKGHVEMFLDGSIAPYDVMNYNPHASFHTNTFDFFDTTDADQIHSVEFRFYGWNGGTPESSLLFDNVTVVLSVVPEVPAFWPIAALVGVILIESLRRGRKARAMERRCGPAFWPTRKPTPAFPLLNDR